MTRGRVYQHIELARFPNPSVDIIWLMKLFKQIFNLAYLNNFFFTWAIEIFKCNFSPILPYTSVHMRADRLVAFCPAEPVITNGGAIQKINDQSFTGNFLAMSGNRFAICMNVITLINEELVPAR